MEGRFLDGPASYRDSKSGEIRPLKYRHGAPAGLRPATIGAGPFPPQAGAAAPMSMRLVHPMLVSQGTSMSTPSMSTLLTPGERMAAAAAANNNTAQNGGGKKVSSTLSDLMAKETTETNNHHHHTTITTTATMTVETSLGDEPQNLSTSLTGYEVLQAARLRGAWANPPCLSDPIPLSAPPPLRVVMRDVVGSPHTSSPDVLMGCFDMDLE